jgi:hypothetical protein
MAVSELENARTGGGNSGQFWRQRQGGRAGWLTGAGGCARDKDRKPQPPFGASGGARAYRWPSPGLLRRQGVVPVATGLAGQREAAGVRAVHPPGAAGPLGL